MNPTFIYDVPVGTFTKEEKKILIELLCETQTDMILEDHKKYESDKYKELEELKVKIKDM